MKEYFINSPKSRISFDKHTTPGTFTIHDFFVRFLDMSVEVTSSDESKVNELNSSRRSSENGMLSIEMDRAKQNKEVNFWKENFEMKIFKNLVNLSKYRLYLILLPSLFLFIEA